MGKTYETFCSEREWLDAAQRLGYSITYYWGTRQAFSNYVKVGMWDDSALAHMQGRGGWLIY